jgi:hypothetical protein
METYVIGSDPARFLYLMDKKRLPRICIARTLSTDKNAFFVAYAIFNENDKFDKKYARGLAAKRLNDGDSLLLPLSESDSDLIEALLASLAFFDFKDIVEEKEYPQMRLVQKLAKLRLKEYRDRKDLRTGFTRLNTIEIEDENEGRIGKDLAERQQREGEFATSLFNSNNQEPKTLEALGASVFNKR